MRPITALLVLSSLLASTPLSAQNRDAVFLHGLKSGPEVWQAEADRMASRVTITPYRPRLDWGAFYETQAAGLEGQLGGLPSNVIAVGHSNGGIVAREWSRHRSVGSIITLGSPNQGAPFVDHIFEWTAFADDVLGRISNVNKLFVETVSRDHWWWLPRQWIPLFNSAIDFWDVARQGLLSLGLDVTAPILSEMRQGSSYMANLNSPTNLNREAAAVPQRAAILSVPSEFDHGGPFRVMKPDSYEDWHNGLLAVGIGLDAVAFIVRTVADVDDVDAFILADHINAVADWALQFEEVWCRAVSDPSPIFLGRCYENDGIVPVWSQAYDYPHIPLFIIRDGPVHTRETSESDDALYNALTTVAQVPLRSPASLGTGTGGQVPAPPPVPLGRFKISGGGCLWDPNDRGPDQCTPPPPPTGRFKVSGGSCVWDVNDSGPNQCTPPPPPGAFRLDTQGSCYWDATGFPPDNCAPPPEPTGRFKANDDGSCYWDPNDGGPNQCLP